MDGSFSCSCTEGYELQTDNITCMGELVIKDITSDCYGVSCKIIMNTASSFCSNTNECDQNCVLLDGVKQCSCVKGYSLAEDGLTCQGLLKQKPCMLLISICIFPIDVN